MPVAASVVRRAAATLLAALLAGLLAALLAACSGGSEPEADPIPTPPPSLSDLATDLSVARAGFCPLVAPTAVEEALGGPARRERTWDNGDRTRIAPGVRDVVHEYGCAWIAAGAEASAWVFAPPVTRERARELADASAAVDGCRRIADGPDFGSPSAAVRCTEDGTTVTALQGLFGDAWLTCRLTGSDTARLERWCTAVATAAS